MKKICVQGTILGGFVATSVMTAMMYAVPRMGMPKIDIAAMLGSMLGGSWWLGMIEHFINGSIIFPLIYAYLLYSVLPGQPWLKGALWGFTLWFLAQAMVMPMMGMGFFSALTPEPGKAVVGSFMGHLIYGVTLGAIAGRETCAATLSVRENRTT